MSGFQKLLNRRERHQVTKESKQAKEEASAILSWPNFRGFFASQFSSADNDNHDASKKIKQLQRRVADLGMTGMREEHIGYALQSAHAQGDPEKAFDLLLLLEDSIEGILRGYTPSTKLLGAENRKNVTCYLDALLFAMFARLDCFEPILERTFEDAHLKKLVVMLRLWVNMLRSGKLITQDIVWPSLLFIPEQRILANWQQTKHLQEALAECGWKEASADHQQDASEAFTFLTEKLKLPLLTLKMDIYHTGKEDVSGDHKIINERLLEVAIPESTDRKVTLEDCLEAYFNNKIEVKRHLERQNTSKSMDSMAKCTAHVESIELSSSAASSPIQGASPRFEDVATLSSVTESDNFSTKSSVRTRRNSIVQERFIPDSGSGEDTNNEDNRTDLRRGSYRKEVMMPAWQFFSLIPWYTDNTPTNNAQVAEHISRKRPILGMCLKRYSVLPNGQPARLDTFVDIPTEIGLPHFIQDDSMYDDAPLYGNFKLSLQALVCHRGKSVDSGHYIAIVRGTSAGAAPAKSSTSEQSSSDSSKYWMRFDDLADERVTLVDIEQALKDESPYLLFYQILPINEDAAKANMQKKPPSESSDDSHGSDAVGIAHKLNGSYTEGSQCGTSGRPSFEITGPQVTETEVSGQSGNRQSIVFSNTSDPSMQNGGLQIRPHASVSPKLTAKDQDSTNSGPFSFSRRGSRVRKSNPGSRAESQTSENRISATFSRFTGRLSRDKFHDDGSGEGEGEEYTGDNDLLGSSAERSLFNGSDSKEKLSNRGRSRHRGKRKSKAKSKDKPKDKTGKKMDRECLLM